MWCGDDDDGGKENAELFDPLCSLCSYVMSLSEMTP